MAHNRSPKQLTREINAALAKANLHHLSVPELVEQPFGNLLKRSPTPRLTRGRGVDAPPPIPEHHRKKLRSEASRRAAIDKRRRDELRLDTMGKKRHVFVRPGDRIIAYGHPYKVVRTYRPTGGAGLMIEVEGGRLFNSMEVDKA